MMPEERPRFRKGVTARRWVERNIRGIHWKVRSDFLVPLIRGLGERLAEGELKGEVLRENPFHLVCRVKVQGKALVVKEYRWREWRRKFLYLFRRSKAEREWEKTEAAALKGIPTIEIIAIGEKKSFGFLERSIVISRELAGAEVLSEVVLQQLPRMKGAEGREFLKMGISQFAGFVAELHRRGLYHHDFHPGNILLRREGLNLHFFIIDLDRARIGRTLPVSKRISSLVRLNRFFRVTLSSVDRWRFLREYLRHFPDMRGKAVLLARKIERKTGKSLKALYRRLDRRCIRRNNYFAPVRCKGLRWYVRRDALDEGMLKLLEEPNLAFEKGICLKRGRTNQVVEYSLEGTSRSVIVKRTRHKRSKWYKLWLYFFRRSKALYAWRKQNAFIVRGLPVPVALAAGERRRWGYVIEGFLITEKVLGVKTLGEWPAETLNPPVKRDLIQRMARLLRNMHGLGFDHRDLKAQNILIEDVAGKPEGICLLDLEGVRLRRHMRRGRVMQNFSRLNGSLLGLSGWSATDRLRFLKAYLQRSFYDREVVRKFWEGTRQRTARKVFATLRGERFS